MLETMPKVPLPDRIVHSWSRDTVLCFLYHRIYPNPLGLWLPCGSGAEPSREGHGSVLCSGHTERQNEKHGNNLYY